MTYTIKPEHKYAKAYGRNLRISRKDSTIICRVIRKKPLQRAKRLLNDLASEKRSLKGKYYTKAVKEIISLLNSCEKNADFLGLDNEKLFVHASAHTGPIFRRRRRKAAYGSRMKTANMEIMLIERGKEKKETIEQLKRMAKQIKQGEAKPEAKTKPADKEASKKEKKQDKGKKSEKK